MEAILAVMNINKARKIQARTEFERTTSAIPFGFKSRASQNFFLGLIFTVSQEVFISARMASIYDQRCLVIFISCRIKERLMLPGSDS